MSEIIISCRNCGHPKYKTYWEYCPCCGKKVDEK